MTLAGQNFNIFQGDNKRIIATIRDENDQVLDLSGYNAVWCVHNRTPDQVVFQKSTTDGGITIPTPTNGQLIITLDSQDTDDLIPKQYGHQCEIEDASGNHATVFTGFVKVLKSITHSEL